MLVAAFIIITQVSVFHSPAHQPLHADTNALGQQPTWLVWCTQLNCFSCVRLFVTLWTVALQAPLSMGFSSWEYWSMLPFPSPGDIPDSWIEPTSPAWVGGSYHWHQRGATILVLHRADSCPRTESKSNLLFKERVEENLFRAT